MPAEAVGFRVGREGWLEPVEEEEGRGKRRGWGLRRRERTRNWRGRRREEEERAELRAWEGERDFQPAYPTGLHRSRRKQYRLRLL